MSPTPKVLILTPVKNAVDYWATYWRLIEKLDWPKEALSLGVLESDSNDGTFDLLQRERPKMERRLSRVTLHKRDFNFQIPRGVPRWEPAFQLARRQVLARSRNHLLFAALKDEDWVMWIDVDMTNFPSDTIQRLLAHERDIIQPHCVL
ncbi:MAG: glycosyltransferase, group 2 family protein, partial [Pseudomonadota bacterium]